MTDHDHEHDVDVDVPLASVAFLTSKRETGTTSGFREDDVIVPTPAGPLRVRVRGLSRQEVIHVQNTKGVASVEALTLSLGLLEPKMTVDQVKAWQKVSEGGEMEPVTQRIGELSGMLKDSRKDAIKEMLADPGVEFRVHAGDEDRDDGGQDAPGDAA